MIPVLQNALIPIVLSMLVLNTAIVLGNLCLLLLGRTFYKQKKVMGSLAGIVGYGVLAYVTLIISMSGAIPSWAVWSVIVLAHVLGFKMLRAQYASWYASALSACKTWSVFEKIVATAILCSVLFYTLSALVPPYRTDAVAYHVPEAISMVQEGFQVQVGDELFFGNLPLLLETLYGFGYVVGGTVLMHLIHFQIVLLAVAALYSFVREEFSRRAGLISALLLFSLYELFVNGTNAYIDAAATSFEVVAVIGLIRFIAHRQVIHLRVAGLLYGCAVATKYNALYGLLLGGLIALIAIIRMYPTHKERFKRCLDFAIPFILFGLFWYVKNAIAYHNPVFPFYFGHPGYTVAQYTDLVATINLFELERTFGNYLKIPFHFFLSPYYILTFLAVFAWPFVPMALKQASHRTMIKVCSFYILVYSLMWFFFATHQLKFFFVPMVLLLLLFGLVLERLYSYVVSHLSKTMRRNVLVLGVVLCAVFAHQVVIAKDARLVQTKVTEWRYVVGSDSRVDFYHKKNLGHIYEMSDYINTHFTDTTFLNVWESPDFFLSSENAFQSAGGLHYSDHSTVSTTEVLAFLEDRQITYVLLDGYEKFQSFNEPVRVNNPAFVKYRSTLEEVDMALQDSLEEIHTIGPIGLYRLK